MKAVAFALGVLLLSSFNAAFPQTAAETQAKLLEEEPKSGLELWETMMGRLWIPSPGLYVIKHLQWEQMIQRVYHHPLVHVRPGDVVIDCGAHIGGFTQVALRAGARLVVAIEPEQANLRAFRRNFEQELGARKVILVEKGVWDTTGKLALHLSTVGDSHSVVIPQNQGKDETIEVTTLDALADSLRLPRVDFIKMDIEGAELKALAGARRVLNRFQPRLAISSYHQKGDPAAICAIVWQARSDYLIASKDIADSVAAPKVLFFYRHKQH
ncbi:MAG TPA: FkbM family methyltransferase [Acidobacteriota bacterium]|nr:FkbM family methyltransferase [Acidobacteriota bacterium]